MTRGKTYRYLVAWDRSRATMGRTRPTAYQYYTTGHRYSRGQGWQEVAKSAISLLARSACCVFPPHRTFLSGHRRALHTHRALHKSLWLLSRLGLRRTDIGLTAAEALGTWRDSPTSARKSSSCHYHIRGRWTLVHTARLFTFLHGLGAVIA